MAQIPRTWFEIERQQFLALFVVGLTIATGVGIFVGFTEPVAASDHNVSSSGNIDLAADSSGPIEYRDRDNYVVVAGFDRDITDIDNLTFQVSGTNIQGNVVFVNVNATDPSVNFKDGVTGDGSPLHNSVVRIKIGAASDSANNIATDGELTVKYTGANSFSKSFDIIETSSQINAGNSSETIAYVGEHVAIYNLTGGHDGYEVLSNGSLQFSTTTSENTTAVVEEMVPFASRPFEGGNNYEFKFLNESAGSRTVTGNATLAVREFGLQVTVDQKDITIPQDKSANITATIKSNVDGRYIQVDLLKNGRTYRSQLLNLGDGSNNREENVTFSVSVDADSTFTIVATDIETDIDHTSDDITVTTTQTFVVDDDGSGNYTLIQTAVDNATDGDTVKVRSGTYREEVTLDKNITLIAPDTAVLNGSTVGTSFSTGITIQGSHTAPLITGFNITNYDVGVQTTSSSSGWIVQNTKIRNSSFAGVYSGYSGGGWIIRNTTIMNSQQGVFAPLSRGGWLIQNTTIWNSSSVGVDASYSSGDWTIQNTDIRNNATKGVDAYNSTGNWTIKNSTIVNNLDGVDASRAKGRWKIKQSRIAQNSRTGLVARGTNTGTATYIWWGAPSGPNGSYKGAGDAVAGDVSVNPIYVDKTLTTINSNATSRSRTTPKTLVVDDNGPADANKIQGAIDRAIPGDTVEVHPGTYTQPVRADINITLTAPRGADLVGQGSKFEQTEELITIPVESHVRPTIQGFRLSNAHTGVDARSSYGAWTIRNTTIEKTVYGIVASFTTGDWTVRDTIITNISKTGVTAPDSSGKWKIYNSIITNTDGKGLDAGSPLAGPSGNATYNYWGASDGPSGSFSGSGVKVTGNVTVRPFYTDANQAALSGAPTTCVADSVSGDDDAISLAEIQEAINWWAEGKEVPDTGGETISLTKIQSLINDWAEGIPVSCS